MSLSSSLHFDILLRCVDAHLINSSCDVRHICPFLLEMALLYDWVALRSGAVRQSVRPVRAH